MPSVKEEILLNFITNINSCSQKDVTVKLIEKDLGREYVGAIGQLIRENLIETTKKKVIEPSNPYGWRYTKVYFLKKKEIE